MGQHILLVGYGKLAQHVADELMNAGWETSAIKRTPQQSSDTKTHFFYLDITQRHSLSEIKQTFDVVLITLTPGSMTDEAYQQTYQVGTENIMAWLSKQPKQPTVVFVSSTRVYAQHQGEWVDENSAALASDAKSKAILAAERAVLNASKKNIVVRSSGIYGANRNRLLERIKQGLSVQRKPPYYTNRIHQTDLVRLLIFLLVKAANSESLKSLYIASDSDPADYWQVASFIASHHDGVQPTEKDVNANASQNKRCSNQRILDLGFTFKYPSFRDGYLPD